MSEAVLAGLRELSGPELYLRNAFRVTDLPVDVDRRSARHRQQRLAATLQVGADVDGVSSAARPEDVRAAFDIVLGDPRRRIVHEIFAAWGPPDGCGCPASPHTDHDRAVRAHSEVIDTLLADGSDPAGPSRMPSGWSTAAKSWTKTLRSATFWRHLHHRVERLDDRQLDASIVDVLRAELPVALVRPLVVLAASVPRPGPLRKGLDEWPISAEELDRLIEEVAEPWYAEFDAIIDELHGRLRSGDFGGAVREMRDRVKPVLTRLTGFAPSKRHRRTAAARDRAAVLLNNCAMARFEAGGYDGRVQAWLAEAEKLATDPETLDRIRENREGFQALDEIRDKVEEIRRTRGTSATRLFLHTLLYQATSEPLANALRGMLAELDARTPAGYARRVVEPVRQRSARGRLRRSLAVACALLVLGYVVYRITSWGSEPQLVNLHEFDRRDNPKPVVCVADADDRKDGSAAVTAAWPRWRDTSAGYAVCLAPRMDGALFQGVITS